MSKLNIFPFLYNIVREKFSSIYHAYLKANNIDVCKVYYENKIVKFTTSTLNSFVNFDEYSLEKIRRQCGEDTLFKKGLPKKEKEVPVIYLYTDFSFFNKCIVEFGITKTFKMIKDWNGDSESNGLIVVKYKVLGS